MKEIAKDVFAYLLDRSTRKRKIYNSEYCFFLKNKNTLIIRFSSLGMTFLQDFIAYAKEREIFFYIEPEGEDSISMVIKPSKFAKMTEEEREEAFKQEKEEDSRVDFREFLDSVEYDEES